MTEEDVAKKTQCAVCMVDFSAGEEATKMPCEHPFHGDCLKPWLDIVLILHHLSL
jgi:E3 ubiquitin-protein ligase RNF115/126